MMPIGKDAIVVGLACLLTAGAGFGCVAPSAKRPTLQPTMQQRSYPRAPQGPAPAVPDDRFRTEPTVDLSEIEEFLRRTDQYAEALVENTPTPPNAVPAHDPQHTVQDEERVAAGSPIESRQNPHEPPTVQVTSAANAQMSLTDEEPAEDIAPALPVIESVSVRSAIDPPPVVGDTVKTSTTNEPLDTAIDDSAMTPDDIIDYLMEQAVAKGDFDSQWRLRLTLLAMARDSDAADISDELPFQTRRVMAALVDAVVAARRAARDPYMIEKDMIDRVNDLRLVLSELAAPMIPTVSLCRRVTTFGVYEPMKPDAFLAGHTTHTIVYCEIENFKSEATDDGSYRTVLASRLEVFSAAGQSMWVREEPEVEDVCRRRRADFFLAQRVSLPPTLPAGDYVLKVTITDKLSGLVGGADCLFTVQAPISVAGAG